MIGSHALERLVETDRPDPLTDISIKSSSFCIHLLYSSKKAISEALQDGI